MLSLNTYGSKVEAQDDTGTPYPAKVTFGVDPRGARRRNTLIADTSYDITLLIENVSTRATKVRSIQIVGWQANLATGGRGGSISFIHSHPVMVVPEQASSATPARTTAPSTSATPTPTTTNIYAPTSRATSAASSMEPGTSQSASSLEFNTNRYGGDFHSFEIADSDPRKCERACNDDRRYKSWSDVKPNVQGPNARCWLKNVVPRATPNSCCISELSR